MPDATDPGQLGINHPPASGGRYPEGEIGYPGTPMGAAPTAYALWQRYLTLDPAAPEWMNSARFVLSAGHAVLPCG
jgi:transketolase